MSWYGVVTGTIRGIWYGVVWGLVFLVTSLYCCIVDWIGIQRNHRDAMQMVGFGVVFRDEIEYTLSRAVISQYSIPI